MGKKLWKTCVLLVRCYRGDKACFWLKRKMKKKIFFSFPLRTGFDILLRLTLHENEYSGVCLQTPLKENKYLLNFFLK